MLLHDYSTKKLLSEKYAYVRELYNKDPIMYSYVIANNISIFAPFPKPLVSYDISEEQKLCVYNEEVKTLLKWIKINIILKLDILDNTTLNVLIRIATGILNKINISDEIKQLFHTNMVKNLNREHFEIIAETLPF